MKLKGNFQIPKVNLNKFQQTLHGELTTALVGAAKAYLGKVVPESTQAGIPVWSGASRATFSQLASHVEYVISCNPVHGAPNRIALGTASGTAIFEPGTVTRGVYTFAYATTLKHLIINEYHDARQWGFRLKRPGPYHFQEKGKKVFEQFASSVVLPGWGSLLDVVQLRVG